MTEHVGLTEEMRAVLGAAKVRFWVCLQRDHRYVTWTGDVARCDTCGLTSEDTGRFADDVRAATATRIIAAGWRPPAEVAALVEAARAGRDVPAVTAIGPGGDRTADSLTDLLGEPTPERRAQLAADLAAVAAAERGPRWPR